MSHQPSRDAPGGAEPFADEDELYRWLRRDWVDGSRITGDAIQFACSVDWSRRSTPQETMDRAPRAEGVAGIMVPSARMVLSDPKAQGDDYRTDVFLCPENDNPAHSEIRVLRNGAHFDSQPDNKTFKKFRAAVRDELAKRMRVIIAPPSGAVDDDGF